MYYSRVHGFLVPFLTSPIVAVKKCDKKNTYNQVRFKTLYARKVTNLQFNINK